MCCLKLGSSVGLVLALVLCLLQGATTTDDTTAAPPSVDFCNPPAPMCQNFKPDEVLTHVMCKYPASGPSDRCDKYKSKPMDDQTRAKVLRRHNAIRNRVAMGVAKPQPSAANMRQLSWSDELASYAQRWVEQCVDLDESPHDECRDTPTSWVGQNVGVVEHNSMYDHFDAVDELVVDFYNEINQFDEKAVRKFDANPLVVGHYAQLVWAETTQVGCARASYDVTTPGGERRHTRLVCNYAPSGLISEEPVYHVGVPCSGCPNGTSCSVIYPALCSTPEQKEETQYVRNTARSIGDFMKRSDRGVRFVVGTFVNGRCYCHGRDNSRGRPLGACASMMAVPMFSLMYRRIM